MGLVDVADGEGPLCTVSHSSIVVVPAAAPRVSGEGGSVRHESRRGSG